MEGNFLQTTGRSVGFHDFDWVFKVFMPEDEKKKIRRRLKEMYPNSYVEFKLYEHIKSKSCRYCLEYGHQSPTLTDPNRCPFVPSNFDYKVEELSRKYGMTKATMAKLALDRLNFRDRGDNNPDCSFNWNLVERDLMMTRPRL